ncbi:DUF2207 domain-containing protein [Kineococcus gynurae]|uniref:DUF2207 domain-containing protein n=1 Tax=Kineococcus gynurae TaxID=452979 RepID=A0ABV5LX58_9ACTN
MPAFAHPRTPTIPCPGTGARRGRGRTLGLRLAAVVLAAGVSGGPLAASAAAAEEPGDDEAVRSIQATLTVEGDGSLRVREEITYDFGSQERHGLLRTIPVTAPFDQTHDRLYPVGDLTVSSPSGAPVQVQQETDGGVLELRIGDPDRDDVTGVQTYVLDYRMQAVADRTPTGVSVAVDAVGTGWAVPVREVGVSVETPVEPIAVRCVFGADGSRTPCPAAVTSPGGARFEVTGLGPEEGVTVGVDLPPGAITPAAPVLTETFSPARAFSLAPAPLGAALGVLALGGAAIVAARRRHRDRPDRRPGGNGVEGVSAYHATPPDGVAPGVLGSLVHGGATDDHVVATVLDLARRGHLEIEAEGTGPTSEDEPGEGPPADYRLRRLEGRDALSPAERRLLKTLFRKRSRESTLSALRTRASAGTAEVRQLLDEAAVERGWFTRRPVEARSRWVLVAVAVLVAGLVATGLLAWLTTFGAVGAALTLVGVAGLVGMVGVSPLTPAGHAVRADGLAFRDTLARYAQVPGADGERFGQFLPHAVALGATKEWTAGARTLQATSPVPVPDWFGRSEGATLNIAVFGGLIGTFSARSSDALGAPAPSATSSTSGTSTFTGGGAGGGGGGSW